MPRKYGILSVFQVESCNPSGLFVENYFQWWQDSTGAAWLFSQQDGSLLSYTSPDGVVIEVVSAYLAVHWVNDAVSQVWSYWDGLLQVENATDSGYTLALYTPDQVGGRDDSGAFTLFPGAEPFKSFDFAWHGDSLSVTERSQLLNEVVTTWQQDVSGA